MKAFVKVTTGLAFSTMVLAQPALAESSRAMDARLTTAAPATVVGVRQTPAVSKKNKASGGSIVALLAGGVAAGVGVAAAAGAFDDDNGTSP